MLTSGQKYWIYGNISNPPNPATEHQIMSDLSGNIIVAPKPVPSSELPYAVFVPTAGPNPNEYILKCEGNSRFLQSLGVPPQEVAVVEPVQVNVLIKPTSDPEVYVVQMASDPADSMTMEGMAPGDDVHFGPTQNGSDTQKWKFVKSSAHQVKYDRENNPGSKHKGDNEGKGKD